MYVSRYIIHYTEIKLVLGMSTHSQVQQWIHCFELLGILFILILCGSCSSLTVSLTTSSEGENKDGDSEWALNTPSLVGVIDISNPVFVGTPGIRVTYKKGTTEYINCLFRMEIDKCDPFNAATCTYAVNNSISCTKQSTSYIINMRFDTLDISKNESLVSIVETTSFIVDWVDKSWSITLQYCNTSVIGNVPVATAVSYGETITFNCVSGSGSISGTCTSDINIWNTTGTCEETTTTAPTTQAATTTTVSSYSSSDSTPGNNAGTTSGSDSSLTTATTSSDTTEAPNPPLPGWAIFLIILGALVLVFGGLFIAWWCIQAFRECLHGVSECFPEDHCCGKDYSKGSSS